MITKDMYLNELCSRFQMKLGVLFFGLCSLLSDTNAMQIVHAHYPCAKRRTLTNHTPTVRMVAKVATSCACLTAESAVRTGETPVFPDVALLIELMSTHVMPRDTSRCSYIMPHDIMSSVEQSHVGIGLQMGGVG